MMYDDITYPATFVLENPQPYNFCLGKSYPTTFFVAFIFAFFFFSKKNIRTKKNKRRLFHFNQLVPLYFYYYFTDILLNQIIKYLFVDLKFEPCGCDCVIFYLYNKIQID